jgi:glyceraldehyde-3-phosphate dehydrogenase/erythrose-4-phosphate dehydrogenase
MKVAINGFGRIGRAVFRVLAHDGEIQIVAVSGPGRSWASTW